MQPGGLMEVGGGRRVRTALGAGVAVAVVVALGACTPPAEERPRDTASEVTTAAAADVVPDAAVDAASQRLLAFFDRVYEDMLEASPIMAARLGHDPAGARWDDWSAEGIAADRALLADALERLRADFDPAALDPNARMQHRILEEELELRLRRHDWRSHAYPLNQIVGLHLTVASTLTSHQRVGDADDARAYIARLRGVRALFEDFVADLERREADGVLMPRSVYPLLVDGARALVSGQPFDDDDDNPVWTDFRDKVEAAASIDSEERDALLAEGREALLGPYRDGYRLLIERLEYERGATEVDGGVWQLPEGDDYYAFAVRLFTTTDITPAEVHALGLEHVERIHGEMRAIKRRTGFDGTLDEFFDYLRNDTRFQVEDSDAGRAEYLALAEEIVAEAEANLDRVVTEPPSTPVRVRRFPTYREGGGPGGFYEAPSAPGDPGTVYLNLGSMASNPLWGLPALLYHEGPPGHHLQIATILETPDVPELRKIYVWWLNTAFIEGWALYAEYLPSELGLYRDDYAEFGRLSAELWRACRLVVDSGLHYKRWTRDEAIEWLYRNTASSREANAREVDRFLAVPGQATAFMVGMQKILEVREWARDALGEDFDVRAFHDVVLRHGNIPLWAMEQAVREWVDEARGARP